MNDLDKLLRDDARIELPDEGFSARVMGAIPAAPARARPWLKTVLVLGSATVGSLLAAFLSPLGGSLIAGFNDLMHLRTGSPGAIASIAICGALLLSAVVLATDPD
jgi:hypothetical protein